MKRHMGWMVLVALALIAAWAIAGLESKYNGTYGGAADTAAEVTFGPNQSGPTVVKSIYATTDLVGGMVKLYARPVTLSRFAPTWNAASGATNIGITANTSAALTNGDTCVYVHKNGTCDKLTVLTAGSTNVYFTSGISALGTNGDYLYEVTLQGQILVGKAGTGVNTNDVLETSGDVFATPADSPLYVVVNGTSNTLVHVTAEK